MNHHVYVGPYLKVPHTLQPDGKVTFSCSAGCGNRDLRAAMKFCSHCGAKVASIPSGALVLRALSPYALAPQFEDLMWSPEGCQGGKHSPFSVWLPNLRGMGKTLSDDSDTDAFELNPALMQASMENFHAEAAGLLEELNSKLDVPATLHFGVVPYWS